MKSMVVAAVQFLAFAALDGTPPPSVGEAANLVHSIERSPSAQGLGGQAATAAQLLAQRLDARAKLRSYRYVLESSTELEARITEQPYKKLNGTSRSFGRIEFCTDGQRYRIRRWTWGNVKSTTEFLTEDRCPYNSLLWDGRVFFDVVATTATPGRVGIDTRGNLPRHRELIFQQRTLLWHWPGAALERQLLAAGNLRVRPAKERVDEAECQVIEAQTPAFHFLLWLNPDRGGHLVKAALWDRQGSTSNSLDHVVLRDYGGLWIPVEGVLSRSRAFANGDYERSREHLAVRELTLNPDHEALRSFVADDIRNGAWVQLNSSVGDRFNPRDLPIWQDGKVLARDGRILMDFSPAERGSRARRAPY